MKPRDTRVIVEPTARTSWQRCRLPVLAAVTSCLSAIPPLERVLVTGFTSDDAAWQVALSTWRPWTGHLVLPENTYVLHMPLFVLTNMTLPGTRWAIFVTALVLHALGLMLMVDFARHAVAQVRRADVDELPWRLDLLVLGSVAAYQLALPATRIANAGVATRNLEAGLYLLAIRLGYEIVSGRRDIATARQWAAVTVAVAVLGLDDPLSIVTLVVPMIVLTAVGIAWRGLRRARFDPRWDRARSLAIAGSVGVGGWAGARLALPLVGVRQRSNGTGPAPLSAIDGHAREALRGLVDMIGGGLGSDPSALVRVIGGLLIVTAVSGVVAVVVLAWSGWRDERSDIAIPWLAVLSLVWLGIVSTTYVVSSAGASLGSFRYVIVASPAIGVAVAVGTSVAAPVGRAAVAALALVSVLVAGPAQIVRDDNDQQALLPDVALEVERLSAIGYDRGYSGYWTSSILTLLSDGASPVLPANCEEGGRSVPHDWLVDMGQFERALHDPGDRSFIIVDRREGLRLTCPAGDLVAQHGPPSEVIEVASEIHVWLYEGRDVVADIAGRPDD